MIASMEARKSIRRNLGRRKGQTVAVPNPKADLDLVRKLRVAGDEFDEFEAANAIGKLTSVEVLECEYAGDSYRIRLKTPFCEVTHVVRVPSAKDVSMYRRYVVRSIDLPHGQEELGFAAQPGLDLYKAVAVSSEGYAQGTEVPPHHQFAVAAELVQAIDDLDPPFDAIPNS